MWVVCVCMLACECNCRRLTVKSDSLAACSHASLSHSLSLYGAPALWVGGNIDPVFALSHSRCFVHSPLFVCLFVYCLLPTLASSKIKVKINSRYRRNTHTHMCPSPIVTKTLNKDALLSSLKRISFQPKKKKTTFSVKNRKTNMQ